MTETAILGGGCFWCTEAVFENVRGVRAVTSGYAGGHVDNPDYYAVCGGETGHIEVIKVDFDPEAISYSTVLAIFFATHDPTTLNRQGADVGSQYASAIFYQNEAQKEAAEQVMQEVEEALGRPVVTALREPATFWPAEAVHDNYYARNPNQGYCVAVIEPKLAKFRQLFREWQK